MLDNNKKGLYFKRGKNDIFVPQEYIKPNGKLKRTGKEYIENQLNKISRRKAV